jgi:aldose 1-epimerase
MDGSAIFCGTRVQRKGSFMGFQTRKEIRATSGGQDGTVYVLENSTGSARAEIWPAGGFNCHRWQVTLNGTPRELLYSDPQFFHGAKPTRSGIPILFPFPNRIRDGRFSWAGKEYRLPLNDPSGKNAIHGFACRRPWRVVEHGADESAAWVTGEFQGGRDAAEARDLWPADYLARITYRLEAHALRIVAQVQNPDRVELPFGLGYHPYFHVPFVAGEDGGAYLAQASPGQFWVLDDSLPTGELRPVDRARDLRTPRPVRELSLDDVLHCGKSGGVCRAALFRPERKNEGIRVEASPGYRELVVFTPPHRQAICFEPYTCTTDAINLEQRGIDAGLVVLQPGQQWRGDITLTYG